MADALVLATEESTGRHRRHRHADRRVHARPGHRDGRCDGHRPGSRRSGQGVRRRGRRAGVAAAAREALPRRHRVVDRRPAEHGQERQRRGHPRRPVPRRVRRRHPLRPHRHRRHGADARPTALAHRRAAAGSAPGCWRSWRRTSRSPRADGDRRSSACTRGGGGLRQADARRSRAGGQQGPQPGDHVPLPDPVPGRAVGDPGRVRHQRHRGRRRPGADRRARGDPRRARRLGRPLRLRPQPARRDPRLHHPRDDVRGAQPAVDRRAALRLLLVRPQLPGVRRRRRDADRHGRRRCRRAGRDDGAR